MERDERARARLPAAIARAVGLSLAPSLVAPGLAVVCLAMVGFAAPAVCQARPSPPPVSAVGDTVTVVPNPEYAAGGVRRTLLGSGWRNVWVTPVDVEVFGFDEYAGGVDWVRRGGGNQSITLHLESREDWREYIFRSVDKFPNQGLPPALRGTAVGWAVGDMISGMFPAAPLLVPPFLDALGILHVDPELRIMPDDQRLEEYRDTLAGMLGTVELKANEAPDNDPGFAGSTHIKGTEEFFNDLEESKEHRLDEREFLRARLLDFLINDADRTRDNMRWVRFGEEGDYRWRPLPIDRDWAFLNASGRILAYARRFYPKLVKFDEEIPPITSLTYGTFMLDRRLLQRLTRDDFADAAEEVQAAITDDVIEDGIARMPERWRSETGAPARIRKVIRSRRDQLPSAAMAFYEELATDVEIRGTDEPDLAIIERFADGRVHVTITWPDGDDRAGDSFYDRTFLPSETSEVRVFLHGDDDEARVTGAPSGDIVVRVIGGGSDDRLVDEAGGGATHFYDARGDNQIITARGTHVSTKEWDAPEPNEGLRVGGEWVPDWGGGIGFSPALDYGDAAGAIVGLGPTWTSYGFRRLPYHWTVGARLLYAIRDNSFGVELDGDYRFENSPMAITLDARATPFDAFRFNGYGNDTPDAGAAGLVEQDRITVVPALTRHVGWRERAEGTLVGSEGQDPDARTLRPLVGRLDIGPILIWSETHAEPGSPLATQEPASTGSVARAGLRAALALDRTDRDGVPRRGWRLGLAAAGYPAVGGLPDPFAEASGEVVGYLPLIGTGPHLAVRAGGSGATGAFPAQHAPFVGGRTTLRGYRWERFRGDAAAYGSAELRVPVMPVELLIRWNTGVFGLVDAGRVWFDGESPGGWHTGYGGGVWLTALGSTISAAYARGEANRVYLQLSLAY